MTGGRADVHLAQGRGRRQADLIVDVSCREMWAAISGALERHSPQLVDVEAVLRSGDASSLAAAAVIILAPRISTGEQSNVLIERIRDRFKHVPIYLCARSSDRATLRLAAFARAGADDLFLVDTEADLRIFAASIRRRTRTPVPERVLYELAALLGRCDECAWALWCIRNANGHREVAAFEEMFSIERGLANRRIEKVGLPPLGTLLRLGCSHHAAELRRRGFMPGEIASRLGFPTTKALANLRQRIARSPRLSMMAAELRAALVFDLSH